MRRSLLVVALVGIAVLLGVNFEAWAGGNAPKASCQVDRKPGFPKVVTGLVTVTIYNFDGASGDVDATLRIGYSGTGISDVFRVHFFGNVLTPEDLLCQALANNPLDASGQAIKAALGIPANKELVILGPPENPEGSIYNSSFAPVPGGPTNDATGIADVRIFLK